MGFGWTQKDDEHRLFKGKKKKKYEVDFMRLSHDNRDVVYSKFLLGLFFFF